MQHAMYVAHLLVVRLWLGFWYHNDPSAYYERKSAMYTEGELIRVGWRRLGHLIYIITLTGIMLCRQHIWEMEAISDSCYLFDKTGLNH